MCVVEIKLAHLLFVNYLNYVILYSYVLYVVSSRYIDIEWPSVGDVSKLTIGLLSIFMLILTVSAKRFDSFKSIANDAARAYKPLENQK